jgi:hypothetical protein
VTWRVAVGLPGETGKGNAVAAITGMAVGLLPGRSVGVRVGKRRVGVLAVSPASREMTGENCVRTINPPTRQTHTTPPMIAMIAGKGIGRRVKCAREVGSTDALVVAGVAMATASGGASDSGGAGGSGKLGLSAGGRGMGGRNEGNRIAAGLRTGSAGGSGVVGALGSSGMVDGGEAAGALMD